MMMASIQFYKNKYVYPHYSDTITSYGMPMDCTPVGMNLRSGTLRVKGDMTDFMSCNYLAFTRDNQTLYAWIDDVRFRTSESFDVDYSVDAWRTFKSKINLGTQMIDRRPEPTSQKDPFLGAEQDYLDIESTPVYPSFADQRHLVVQVRRMSTSENLSTHPVQPSAYNFYLCPYSVANWQSAQPIMDLLDAFASLGEPSNIVTLYSIPYYNYSGMSINPNGMPFYVGNTQETSINGFYRIPTPSINGGLSPNQALTTTVDVPLPSDLDALLRVNHSIQIVVPDAGVIDVPDELLFRGPLKLRYDVDLFSGAVNYMLTTEETTGTDFYTQSVRGSSVSSIPIVSDPMDTYLSQNQNTLTASLLGDIATIGTGVALAAGTGGVGAFAGAGAISSGITGMVNRGAQSKDAGNRYSNPPAFLGTALAGNFSNMFWVVTRREPVDNATDVHTNYGYQYGKVTSLALPTSGFIKTVGCSVETSDGSVPRWAVQEINQLFDSGLHVH
jgi:hypothetical protein